MGFWFFDQLERNRLKAIARGEQRDRRNLSYQQYIGHDIAGKAIIKGANGEAQVGYTAESQLRPGEMGRGGAISLRGQRTKRIPNRIFSTASGFPFKAVFGTTGSPTGVFIGGDRAGRTSGFTQDTEQILLFATGRGANDWVAVGYPVAFAQDYPIEAVGLQQWTTVWPVGKQNKISGNLVSGLVESPTIVISDNTAGGGGG